MPRIAIFYPKYKFLLAKQNKKIKYIFRFFSIPVKDYRQHAPV